MVKDIPRFIGESAVGGIVAFTASLPPTVLALLVLQAADFITGLMAGYVVKNLDSRVSYIGLMKKALVLVVVAVSSYLGSALQLPNSEIIPTAIAGFYGMHEGLSIVENLAVAGVPLPPFITKALKVTSDSKDST